MDIGVAQGTILGISGVGGLAGLGTTLKSLYDNHCYREDKAALIKEIEDDRKACIDAMKSLRARTDDLAEEIKDNALVVAREYVPKVDFEKLKDHLDGQFKETRNLIMTALSVKKSDD